ncbi:MAG: hypothetical protein QNJ15_11045 [Erythrobacter sp.]|nr:hypothetical protein [Erythrobacter sp.]
MTDHFAGLLTSPDFAYHGNADILFETLERLGANIVFVAPVQLTPGDVTALYQDRMSNPGRKRDSNSVWLSRHLHGMHPSTFLLLHRADRDGLQEELARSKGSSVRTETKEGTIRDASPIVDRCFSLVHTPDSSADLLEDLTIFFGKDAVDLVLRTGRSIPHDVARLLLPQRAKVHSNALSGIVRLAATIAAFCSCGIWGDRQTGLHRVAALQTLEDTLEQRAIGQTSLPETLDLIWADFSKIASPVDLHPITADLRPHAGPEAVACLIRAAGRAFQRKSGNLQTFMDLLAAMRLCSMNLDEWEAHRLMCQFSFEMMQPPGAPT